jgi:hypothetical protein
MTDPTLATLPRSEAWLASTRERGEASGEGHELHEKPRPVSAAWQRVSYLRQNSAKIVRHLLEHNWRR